MPTDDFPDVQDGEELTPYHLNIIYRELRKLRKVKGASPITVEGFEQGGSVPVIRFADSAGIVPALVTSDITSGTRAAMGSGEVTFQVRNGAALINGTTTAIKVWNYHDKTAGAGYIVGVYQYRNDWYLFDIDSCLHLS